MASSTFSDIPSVINERNSYNNTLIIIVNNDGTLSVDQETLHNLLAEQENTSTTAVRLIRLGVAPDDCSRNSSDSEDSESSHVNITVEGYYPPSMGQAYQNNNEDVDPFLGMDPEEMERLESALQSDQAKQILGEDVAAMLDILTVDDVMTSSQLSDSIKMDHCYTNKVQSSEPVEKVSHHPQYTPNVESHARSTSLASQTLVKTTGRLRKEPVPRNARASVVPTSNLVMVQQIKSINPPLTRVSSPLVRNLTTNKIVTVSARVSAPASTGKDSVPASGSILKKNNITSSVPRQPVLPMSITEEMLNEKLQEIQRSTDDYTNLSGDDQEDKSNSSAEPNVEMEEVVDIKTRMSQDRRMMQCTQKLVNKATALKGRLLDSTKKSGNKSLDGETSRKLNEELSKIVPSPKSTHKMQTETRSNKTVKKPGINPLKVYKIPMKLNQDSQSKQSILVDASNPPKKPEEKIPTTSPHIIKKNYPKRENRKPPAHLLEVFNGPALFSVPDVPRRVSLDNKVAESRREIDRLDLSSSESALMASGTLAAENVYFEAENLLSSTGEECVISDMTIQQHQAELNAVLLNPGQDVLGRSEQKRRSSSSNETENRTKAGTTGRRKSDEKPTKVKEGTDRLSTELADSSDTVVDSISDALTTEDDPNKLWCICNKPHNNRFMICCDLCEDWFHGVCVGITKALGKAMEEKGNEWTCPNCKKKKGKDDVNLIQSQKQTKITTFMNKSSELPESVLQESPVEVVKASTSGVTFCIVCKKEARNNSIYCSDACILKHAQNSGSPTKNIVPPKTPTVPLMQFKPLAPKQRPAGNLKKPIPVSPNAAQSGSLKAWLKVNPTIKVIQTGATTSTPMTGHHIVVVKSPHVIAPKPKQTQLIAPKPMLPVAPKLQGKQALLMQGVDPTHKPVVTKQEPAVTAGSSVKVAAATCGTKDKQLKVDGKRVSHIDMPKKDEKKHSGADPVRESVRKTLHELLLARIQECDDLKCIPDEKVKKMAVHIEEELFGFFKDTSMKYKSKYRSLVFNIKDPKNLTLFRKIAEKSVTPHQLVRLSPEELASQELAQWREREAKHELEMIKKNEIDLLALSKTYVMKTHKGEQVIETDDGVKSDGSQLEIVDSLEVASNQDSVTSTVSDLSLGVHDRQKEGKKDKSKNSNSKRSKSHKGKKERNKDKKKESRSHSKSSHSKGKHHSKNHGSSRKHGNSSEGHDDKVSVVKDLDEKHNINIVPCDIESEVVDERVGTPVMDATAINEVILGKVNEDFDSDLEPTSTVTIKTPDINSSEEAAVETGCPTTVWKGWAEMYDVAKFFTTIQVVSGDSQTHCESLPPQLSIVGRITPELVWSHVSNMKKTGSYEIMVVRLTATSEDEKIPYVTLYSYLNTRNRLGVVGIKGHVGPVSPIIKDFYILPLSNHSPVPQVLLPLNGPGLEDNRPHLLLGIIVARITKKRGAPAHSYTAKVPRLLDVSDSVVTAGRSYTPPLPDDEPSLPHSALPLPTLSTQKEESSYESVSKSEVDEKLVSKKSYDEELLAIKARVSSLLDDEGEEPYSPGDLEENDDLLSTPTNPLDLKRKMDELNRKIAEQKLEIESMSSAIVGDIPAPSPLPGLNPLTSFLNVDTDVDENEAYSPSASITPPLRTAIAVAQDSNRSIPSVSKNIALPSNLQEILANIKKQSDTKMDLKSDPIVQSYSALKEEEREKEKHMSKIPAVYIPSTIKSPIESQEPGRSPSTLSKLSDAELIEKAAAMERELIAMPSVNMIHAPSVGLIKKAPVNYVLPVENQSDLKMSAPLIDIPMPPANPPPIPPLPPSVYNVPPNVQPPLSPPTIPLLLPPPAARPYGTPSVNSSLRPYAANSVSQGKQDNKRRYEGRDRSGGKKNTQQHWGGHSK